MVKRKTKYAIGNIRKTNRKTKRRMKTRRRRGGLTPSLSAKVAIVMEQDKKNGLIDKEMYMYIREKKLIQSIITSYGGRVPEIRPSDIAIDVYINAMVDRIKELAHKDLHDKNIKQPCLDCILESKLIEKTVENLIRRQIKLPVMHERIQYGRVLHDIPYAKKMFINETPSEILRIVIVEALDECDECE